MGLLLKDKRIVVTRAKEQSGPIREQLEELGATVLELPLVKISPHRDTETLEDVFAEIAQYEMIVFTSTNGVKHFFDCFFEKFHDLRCIGGARIACVGPATARAVSNYHLQVDVVPDEATGAHLAAAIMKFETMDNEKVLVITGNLNRDELVITLEKEGRAIVDCLQVYSTGKTDLSADSTAEDFRKSGADAVIFASPSAVESFMEQAGALQLADTAKKPVTCSIGPVTSEAMRAKGMPLDVEAQEHTIDGIVEALAKHFK